MSMETNLKGRLRNTTLPLSHGLMPLFEAVINSIHATEELELEPHKSKIVVEIIREPELSVGVKNNKKRGPEARGDILGFKVTDNGIGFTDKNLLSFQTLDSEHKVDKGCRGVGRLLWLKAFKQVYVNSVYKAEGNEYVCRKFRFDQNNGVGEVKDEVQVGKSLKRSTSIALDGFEKKYREASRKTTSAIANALLEHCLWYFVRDGGAPSIVVKDYAEAIQLDQVFDEHMHSSASKESITIKDQEFELTHVKLRANSTKHHAIAFCAANRLVLEEPLSGKVNGLFGRLNDSNGDFTYACYVSSSYLDERVRSERTGFDISESIGDLFASSEISFNEIRECIINSVSTHLSDYLSENKKAGRERVDNFVSKKAPRYRPILSRIPEEQLHVNPNISDKELDLVLHKHLAEIERKLISDGHDILTPKQEEEHPDYQRRVQEYLKTAEDIKKSDLASYVSHRRVILDLLEEAIAKNESGNYEKEEVIHGLIMPMQFDSNQVLSNSCNLWLIDERLAFHEYLASDKTLASMPITGAKETKEPDICALNVFDTPLLVSNENSPSLASIVVVEIKRPMRNDAKEGVDKDPVEQALNYLDKIRQGKVKTQNGRPIPSSESIPGFCYVLCDITPSIEKRLKIHDATRTADGMGYFFYNKSFKSYVEIISFDGLVKAAKERNRAFFDQLGLPTT